MKKITLLGVCFIILILSGCGDSSSEEKIYSFLDTIPEGHELVYDVLNDNMGYANTSKGTVNRYVDSSDTFNSVVAYSSFKLGEYYTIGDSVKGNFTLLRMDNEAYKVCYEEENPDIAYFPLDYYHSGKDEKVYMSFENGENEDAVGGIAVWSPDKGMTMLQLPTEAIVMDGAIAGSELFYTVYVDDNCFDLYAVNCETDVVRQVDSSLMSERVISFGNDIYYFKADTAVVGNITLKVGDAANTYYCGNYLFDIDVTADGEPICIVYNMYTGQREMKFRNLFGFSVNENKVYLYSITGGVEELDCGTR
ncbi:MAG: hypothetical protein J6A82_00910 [Coprococcus sp.]|nr:hypothetical protein [Coprococcus sp.]